MTLPQLLSKMSDIGLKEKADNMFQGYANQFSNIEVMTTAELKELLEADVPMPMILVDVRTEAERNISYIPGSIFINDFEKMDWTKDIKECTMIITYCTIGYRSGEIGFKVCFNLESSTYIIQ